jgi:hypothetical protein
MGECLFLRRNGESYFPAVLHASYPKDVSTTVIKGKTTSATFDVLVSEAGNPAEYTYQWFKDGAAVSGATSSSYTISGLGSTVTHTVYCEVTNKGGTVQSRIATLKVTQQYTPVLNTSYPANVTGLEIGKSATFKVQIATAGNPATYTYQWYVNGSAVSGATGSSYTRSNSDFGTFTVYCKVTNAAGTVQSRTATLTVTTVYLFKNGATYNSLTGGWGSSGYSYTNFSVRSASIGNDIKINAPKNQNYVLEVAATGNKVDVTNLTTLYAKVTSLNNSDRTMIGLAKSKALDGNIVASKMPSATGTVNISVANLTGSYYVFAYVSSVYGWAYEPEVAISEIWLK